MYDAYTNDNGINDKIKWEGNIKKQYKWIYKLKWGSK